MTLSATTILLEYVCPALGVVIGWLGAIAPYHDLQKAVKRGHLGDLNPTPWAFLFGNKLGWSTYAIVSKNLWVFCSDCPGMLMAVYLNMGAIKLLYQGHHSNEMRKSLAAYLEDEHSRESLSVDDKEDLETDKSSVDEEAGCGEGGFSAEENMKEHSINLTSTVKDWATIIWNVTSQTTPAPAPHDHMLMGIVVFWTACIAFVAFANSLSSDTKVIFVGIVGILTLVVFSATPLSTILKVLATKTSNSIHIPFLAMNTLSSTFWMAYGFAIQDIFIILPNAIGTVLFSVQIILCVVFPRVPEKLPFSDPSSDNLDLGKPEPAKQNTNVDSTVREEMLPTALVVRQLSSSSMSSRNEEEDLEEASVADSVAKEVEVAMDASR